MPLPNGDDIEFARIVSRNFPDEITYDDDIIEIDNADGHLLDYTTYDVITVAYIPGVGRIDIVFTPDEGGRFYG
jgi:hypothetical protein